MCPIFRDTHFQIIIIVIIGFYDFLFHFLNWIWIFFEELQPLEFLTGFLTSKLP